MFGLSTGEPPPMNRRAMIGYASALPTTTKPLRKNAPGPPPRRGNTGARSCSTLNRVVVAN